jgi:hypothetical protein
VALSVRQQGIANVIDYGVHEVRGAEASDQPEVIASAILRGLTSFRDELRLSPFTDEQGVEVPAAKVLIDCGYSQDAVALSNKSQEPRVNVAGMETHPCLRRWMMGRKHELGYKITN